MSPRKVRLVADLIRGLSVSAALDQLKVMAKHAARPVGKTLKSAVANAEHNFRLDKDALKIAKITIDKGADLKRWRPRAFGRAAPIKKHSCHITIVLSESAVAPKQTETKEIEQKPLKAKRKSQSSNNKNADTNPEL